MIPSTLLDLFKQVSNNHRSKERNDQNLIVIHARHGFHLLYNIFCAQEIPFDNMIKVTREQAEQILVNRFYNKIVEFTYPGYLPVTGKVHNVAFDGTSVILHIDNKRYTCSPEQLNDCIKLMK